MPTVKIESQAGPEEVHLLRAEPEPEENLIDRMRAMNEANEWQRQRREARAPFVWILKWVVWLAVCTLIAFAIGAAAAD